MSKQTAENIKATVQFKETKTPSGKKAFEAWCAVWHNSGIWDTVLCSPSLEALEHAWIKITGLRLNKENAQHVWIVKAEEKKDGQP